MRDKRLFIDLFYFKGKIHVGFQHGSAVFKADVLTTEPNPLNRNILILIVYFFLISATTFPPSGWELGLSTLPCLTVRSRRAPIPRPLQPRH